MKRLFVLIASLLLPCLCLGQELAMTSPAILSGGVAAAGASCPADGSPDITFDNAETYTRNNVAAASYYIGSFWTAPASKQICKIGVRLSLGAGTIVGHTYTLKIWTTSTLALSAVITDGSSTGVAGSDAWSGTWVYFAFSGNPSVTASTVYAITLSNGVNDEYNYANLSFADAVAGVTEDANRWSSNGTNNQNSDSYDMAVKIFYYD
jgi:hypothetical protein